MYVHVYVHAASSKVHLNGVFNVSSGKAHLHDLGHYGQWRGWSLSHWLLLLLLLLGDLDWLLDRVSDRFDRL